ncbi:hypothetical protein Taro_022973 [Colocasia esculenta]|uniref:Uncharacterized protein n=1 Tax=Colocasia esculenta TaxID=4460 RepID=A0A843V9Y1_COLES|nr:hypothetical protein [Colocasia esculenta]
MLMKREKEMKNREGERGEGEGEGGRERRKRGGEGEREGEGGREVPLVTYEYHLNHPRTPNPFRDNKRCLLRSDNMPSRFGSKVAIGFGLPNDSIRSLHRRACANTKVRRTVRIGRAAFSVGRYIPYHTIPYR